MWKPWFFEFGVPDIGIKSLKKDKLVLENKGQKPVPVFVTVDYKDSTTKTIEKTAKVWANGVKEVVVELPDYKNITQLMVNKDVADISPLDNMFPSLKERYAKYNFSEDILSAFQLMAYRMNFEKQDGVIHLVIKDFGLDEELLPVSKTKLVSIDGGRKFDFQFDDKGACTGVNVDWQGYKLEAKKIN